MGIFYVKIWVFLFAFCGANSIGLHRLFYSRAGFGNCDGDPAAYGTFSEEKYLEDETCYLLERYSPSNPIKYIKASSISGNVKLYSDTLCQVEVFTKTLGECWFDYCGDGVGRMIRVEWDPDVHAGFLINYYVSDSMSGNICQENPIERVFVTHSQLGCHSQVGDPSGSFEYVCISNTTYRYRVYDDGYTCDTTFVDLFEANVGDCLMVGEHIYTQDHYYYLGLVTCDSLSGMCGLYFANDLRVCSGNGVCLDDGTCNCDDGYTGTDCEYENVCGTGDFSEITTCNSNGLCLNPSICECVDGWDSVTECATKISCDGHDWDTAQTCSGHGECLLNNVCFCEENYRANELGQCEWYDTAIDELGIAMSTKCSHDNAEYDTYEYILWRKERACMGEDGSIGSERRSETHFAILDTIYSVYVYEPTVTCMINRTTENFQVLQKSQKICDTDGEMHEIITKTDFLSMYGSKKYTLQAFPYGTSDCQSGPEMGISVRRDPLAGHYNMFPYCHLDEGLGLFGHTYCYNSSNLISYYWDNLPDCLNENLTSIVDTFFVGIGIQLAGNLNECLDTNAFGSAFNLGSMLEKCYDANFCWGRHEHSPHVCSGVGECIDHDKCQCPPLNPGIECESFTCGGVDKNDTINTCGGKGQCLGPNFCNCIPGYKDNGLGVCVPKTGDESGALVTFYSDNICGTASSFMYFQDQTCKNFGTVGKFRKSHLSKKLTIVCTDHECQENCVVDYNVLDVNECHSMGQDSLRSILTDYSSGHWGHTNMFIVESYDNSLTPNCALSPQYIDGLVQADGGFSYDCLLATNFIQKCWNSTHVMEYYHDGPLNDCNAGATFSAGVFREKNVCEEYPDVFTFPAGRWSRKIFCDNVPVCNAEENPSACNFVGGECVDDVCICVPGYAGSTCTATTCYGVSNSDEENVCSGKGSCPFRDTCECEVTNSGDECELCVPDFVCNSKGTKCVLSEDENVCVECELGYYGRQCELCDSSKLCNSQGSECTNINGTFSCVCNEGFFGDSCEFCEVDKFCSSHTESCVNENGKPDCVCASSYFGQHCEKWKCFEKDNDDRDVCGKPNGFCSSPENCTCAHNREGDQCEKVKKDEPGDVSGGGGTSTGSLVGGIVGALFGAGIVMLIIGVLIGCILGCLLKNWRDNKKPPEHFEPFDMEMKEASQEAQDTQKPETLIVVESSGSKYNGHFNEKDCIVVVGENLALGDSKIVKFSDIDSFTKSKNIKIEGFLFYQIIVGSEKTDFGIEKEKGKQFMNELIEKSKDTDDSDDSSESEETLQIEGEK